MNRAPISVWLSLVALAALCLVSMSFRYRVESANKAVSIVAESDQIQALAAAQGMSFGEALDSLKQSGLTGLTIGESTVADMVSGGELQLIVDGRDSLTLVGAPHAIDRVHRGLSNRFGTAPLGAAVASQAVSLSVHGIPAAVIRATSVGIDPDVAEAAKARELSLVARFSNPNGASERYVKETVAWAHTLGARYVLPSGDQVLGRRDLLKSTLDAIEKNGMYYVSPEFAKIGGDSNAILLKPSLVVRLHAAQTQEMDKLSLGGAVERYAKAATERGIRILLVRPLSPSAEKPLHAFGSLIQSIGKQVLKEGGALREAHPYQDANVPRWLFVAIGLAIAPIALFVAAQFLPWRYAQIAVAVLVALLGLACWVESGRTYAALLGATILPLAAIALQPTFKFKSPILQFVALTVISSVGGLCVAGLLNGLPYLIRADQFSGVKLAHFAPIGLIGLYYFLKLTDAKNSWNQPILWSQAAIGVCILVGLAFMASRTGNDNPAGVSGFELQLRSLLEQFLVVRPRTKEFMVGHPAMVIGLGLLVAVQNNEALRRKLGGWTALILMVGAIGQTSVVNTMCHLHTPLTIGFARILVGVVIGGILGWLGWGLVRRRATKAEEV